MILGHQSEIYSLAEFTDRLLDAGKGVVRVGDDRSGSRAVGSGWLVTPTLVVVCDYTARGVCSLWCDTGKVERVGARIAHLPGETPLGRLPALLRLDHPLSGTEPLTLDLGTAVSGTAVVLVHHPSGSLETQVSFGRVRRFEDGFMHHDADTLPGSGGAPVLAAPGLGVLALHVGRAPTDTNFALPMAAVLDELRQAADWPQIAGAHRLADVAVARAPVAPPVIAGPPEPDEALIAAALRWTLDPATDLTAGEREVVRRLVVDEAAPRWSLALDQRQRLLREAGSLGGLRDVRRTRPVTEPGHEVIDRILEGPPYDLDSVPLDTLPRWLQAVRWFDGIVPGLPTPAHVHRTLELRRIREGLATVAGPGFRGREPELALLDRWFAEPRPGPMVLFGIGGIGKSALVARFAELLPVTVPLFWLDFDRVDLAPDDAVSLMTELGNLAALQLDGFTAPPLDTTSLSNTVTEFAAAINAVAPGPALLVLDGFEIAQHSVRYQEIWPLLEGLLASAPGMRLLVSGRAPVTDLRLGGRDAMTRQLTGLDPEVAQAWLVERGITDVAVRQRVFEVSRGVPLVLKLAIRLLDAGGSIDDLPTVLVEGYLYHRILDRVVDAELQPIVRGALQLRAVHADMLATVLHDRIPPGMDVQELLERLSRELAVVESLDGPGRTDPEVLRLRPEVRAAVLQLLTFIDPLGVAEIDRRAATWFAGLASDDPADAAELVYHLLRLGEVAAAEAAWRQGCAARLGTAADDLFDPGAKRWLIDRLTAASAAASLPAWERDATGRIQDANKRGLDRTVARTLQEHRGRTPDSPLVVHDAWVRWRAGDPAAAAGLLDEAGPATGSIGRDRALVRAGLAVESGDRRTAVRLLADIADEALWPDPLLSLAVQAALVRLTVDVGAELELATLPDSIWVGGMAMAISGRLVPGDVLLPQLARRMHWPYAYQRLHVPAGLDELADWGAVVHGIRQHARNVWPAEPPPDGPPERVEHALAVAARLGELGEQRWRLATTTLVLPRLCGLAVAVSAQPDALTLGVVASLAAFRGLDLTFGSQVVSIDRWLGLELFDHVEHRLTDVERSPLARSIAGWQERSDERTSGQDALHRTPAVRAVLLYVLSPDPLDVLIHHVLRLPEDAAER